jgi:hypothetical protein
MRATALSLAACGIALVLHQGAAAVAADTPAKPAASADTGTAGDTSTITSLTPEGARKLIAEEKDDTLFLPGVTALDADTAVVLAEFDGR